MNTKNFHIGTSINTYFFEKEYINDINHKQTYTKNYPVVYIIYDFDKKLAYIGESTNVVSRMNNHLSHNKKKKLKLLKVISNSYFNKSAVLDIESSLIKYMSADNKFSLLNGNNGITEHNYFQRDKYREIFNNLWHKLKLENIVKKDILDIENSDLFKYSPYKSLSKDQDTVIDQYLNILKTKKNSCVFIEGSAGTGKTILAVYLIKLLNNDLDLIDLNAQQTETYKRISLIKEIIAIHGDIKIGFVIPMTSLRKTL